MCLRSEFGVASLLFPLLKFRFLGCFFLRVRNWKISLDSQIYIFIFLFKCQVVCASGDQSRVWSRIILSLLDFFPLLKSRFFSFFCKSLIEKSASILKYLYFFMEIKKIKLTFVSLFALEEIRALWSCTVPSSLDFPPLLKFRFLGFFLQVQNWKISLDSQMFIFLFKCQVEISLDSQIFIFFMDMSGFFCLRSQQSLELHHSFFTGISPPSNIQIFGVFFCKSKTEKSQIFTNSQIFTIFFLNGKIRLFVFEEIGAESGLASLLSHSCRSLFTGISPPSKIQNFCKSRTGKSA